MTPRPSCNSTHATQLYVNLTHSLYEMTENEVFYATGCISPCKRDSFSTFGKVSFVEERTKNSYSTAVILAYFNRVQFRALRLQGQKTLTST